VPVSLGLHAHEQEMLDALVASGVEVVPGKRYTMPEVQAIIEVSSSRPLSDNVALRTQDCGALLRDDDGEIPESPPFLRGAYSHRLRSAENKIKEMLREAVETSPDLIGACS